MLPMSTRLCKGLLFPVLDLWACEYNILKAILFSIFVILPLSVFNFWAAKRNFMGFLDYYVAAGVEWSGKCRASPIDFKLFSIGVRG